MYLFELINKLNEIEEALGELITVNIRNDLNDVKEHFVLTLEKDTEGEYILILE